MTTQTEVSYTFEWAAQIPYHGRFTGQITVYAHREDQARDKARCQVWNDNFPGQSINPVQIISTIF